MSYDPELAKAVTETSSLRCEISGLTAELAAMREERDALAAQIDYAREYCVTLSLPSVFVLLPDPAAILASVRANARAEALHTARDVFRVRQAKCQDRYNALRHDRDALDGEFFGVVAAELDRLAAAEEAENHDAE